MALTASSMVNLGTIAPNFDLPDTISGKNVTLEQIKGRAATVVMFLCNHCPYVVHVYPEINNIVKDYKSKGVSFVGISSNDIDQFPQDGPTEMNLTAKQLAYDFPYLFDETQAIAKAFDAACTPDFFVFDENLKLAYRGRIDESRPRVELIKPLTGKDLRGALDAIIATEMISEIQFPSLGCNIKWKTI